ncbi:MAG: hypothetical protein JWR05_1817 [Mucilaginibacter sp.]|nr:hypothetical protein [Mucilaginibacter sp.]
MLGLNYQSHAQSCATPLIVDLSTQPSASVTINATRNGDCCVGTNCVSFLVKINPGTDVINFDVDQVTGSGDYTINCGPLIPTGTPACISGLGSTIKVSFCKPGNNAANYTITALAGITTSGNLNLRQGCTGTMSVSGLIPSTITWTSIATATAPAGSYNGYLSSTSGVASINVKPLSGAPPYIDYQVSGTRAQSSVCNMTASSIIRVYTFPPLTVAITPTNPILCPGGTVTLTANPTGGNPPYSYSWSNGATTPFITVSSAGSYSVSVNDQTASCGPVTASTTVTAVNPVAPTAPPVSACTGSTATVNATASGGPYQYQWYDAATNGLLLSTNPSYITPVFTATGTHTYYVQTTISGCTSARTPVTVTVYSPPAKPGISFN